MRYRCGVMWLDRKLIDYLPPVLQQTREMQAVMEGEQPAVAGLWDAWKTVLDALFVRYANEQGLARWERMLGIRPRGTDSMEVRRVAVLARLNEQLPFTERTLRLMLDGVCGPAGTRWRSFIGSTACLYAYICGRSGRWTRRRRCSDVLSRRTWSLTWGCGTTRTGCSGRGCTGCCVGRHTARCVRRCLLERKQMVWASDSGAG